MEQISYILGTYSKFIDIFVVISSIIYLTVKKKNINRNTKDSKKVMEE